MSVSENKTGTLRAEEHGHQPVICIQENCIDRADTAGCNGKGWTEDKSFTLNTVDRPAVYDPSVHHGYKEFDDVSETVRARYGTGGNNQPLVVAVGNGQLNQMSMSDKANALDTMHDQQAVMFTNVDKKNHVRRLTPLECERLQGYPDGWTDIPGASDSKRYKALGNSIALPFWEHLAHRFVRMGEVESIGSLFDGIGGFPLVFGRAGAETKWTSEIDPFCEEVVRVRFADKFLSEIL